METPIDPQAVPAVAVLEETPHVLHSVLSHAPPDVAGWKPSPDRWSIREVLAHLVDVESAGFRARIEAMVREDDPVLPAYDQMAVISSGKYSARTAPELLKEFEQERAETLRLLLRLPARTLDRAGRHSEVGRVTVRELVNEWAFHDLGHIRQVAELYRSCLFYPRMGAFQRYYTIHP